METSKQLIQRLAALGIESKYLAGVFPQWWDAKAEGSATAQLALRLYLAEYFNIDPASLVIPDETARFLAAAQPKFKGERGANANELSALSSFAIATTKTIAAAIPMSEEPLPTSAIALRGLLLGAGAPYVSLDGLLAVCWSLGIPIVALRDVPTRNKMVAGMAVKTHDRHAIFLTRADRHPAMLSFVVAHELGHIVLGHLGNEDVLIDSDVLDGIAVSKDGEEQAANDFALTLLAGGPQFGVHRQPESARGSAGELADLALQLAPRSQVDPGHFILNFAYRTGDWAMAIAALNRITGDDVDAFAEVNKVARLQIQWEDLGESHRERIEALLR